MSLLRCVPCLGHTAALLFLPLAQSRSYQVNPVRDLIPSADVVFTEVSPDESWIVYIATEAGNPSYGLYSAPSDGSALPSRIAGITEPRTGPGEFQISPDGSRVLYLAGDQEPYQLFSAPIDGSSAAVELAGPHVTRFLVTADSTRVVFRGDLFVDQRFLLWSVPIAGGSALEENGTLPAARDVEQFVLTPDGTRAVYRADADVNNLYELYSALIGPASGVVKLNSQLVFGGEVQPEFQLAGGGSRVIYRADQATNGVFELFSVPVDGSASAVQVNQPLGPLRIVQSDFNVSPDGARVVYRANPSLDGTVQLFSAPSDGSGPVISLTPALVTNGNVSAFPRISPDSAHVVYRADALTAGLEELFAVPIDGSTAAVRLNDPIPPGQALQREFAIAPLGGRVAFLVGSFLANTLFSAPVDGSAAALALDPDDSFLRHDLVIGPHGARLFYVKSSGDVASLWGVLLNGSSPPVALSSGLAVGNFRVVANGTALLYEADEDVASVLELFARNSNGAASPVQFSLEFAADVRAGRIEAMRVAGERVVYSDSVGDSDVFSLYSVPIAGHRAPICISAGGDPLLDVESTSATLAIGAGGTRAVFLGRRSGNVELFSAPILGSAPPVVLSGPMQAVGNVSSFTLSLDGSSVAYLADQELDGVIEVYRTPVDGSSGPTKLSAALVAGGDVIRFCSSADGARVIYVADQEIDEAFELYSTDGLGSPQKLSGSLIAAGDVQVDALLSADGAWAFYRADAQLDGRVELFRAPSDGSTSAVPLSGTIVAGGLVRDGFGVTPDAARVVFRADREAALQVELYSAPADGSAPPLHLSSDGDASSHTSSLLLDPTGARAVFRYDRAGEAAKLFSVPVDGSAAQTLLSPLPNSEEVGELDEASPFPPEIQITSDGARVVYTLGSGPSTKIYASPLDGSAPPIRLNSSVLASGEMASFLVAPSGARVAYLGWMPFSTRAQVFDVPIDRRREPMRLHPELPDSLVGAQHDYAFGPGSATLLYRLDLDRATSFDLFAALLENQPRARTLTPR